MSSQKELNALLRQDLASFIHRTFNTVDPGNTYLHGWHIDAIAHHLTLVAEGHIKRLIITMPPRHLKSISASVAFPAWLLGQDPTRRIVCVSYAQELSDAHAHHMRLVMRSPWYQKVFPGTRFNPQKNPLKDLTTTMGGYRLSSSIGGALTGRGGNMIIIDDPHKANEIESDLQREGVLNWFRNTLLSRLDNKNEDPIIVIQQRLHENDLAGYLLETGEWVHLNLPAIAEEDEHIEIGYGKWHFRKKGDLLHPARESQQSLDEMRLQMGSYLFDAQYQQRPAPLGGGVIQWDWFQTYEKEPIRLATDQVVQSWDPAQTVGENSDWSVCTTWLIRDNKYFLRDVKRFKAEFPDVLHAVILLANEWRPNLILIEAVGSGMSLCQQARQQVGHIIQAVKPKGDKVARMAGESSAIEAGYVHIPQDAAWMSDFRREVVNFPKGKHDDQIDSMSQFLWWARMRGPNRPRLECRVTTIGGGPDLDSHLGDLW